MVQKAESAKLGLHEGVYPVAHSRGRSVNLGLVQCTEKRCTCHVL
jgi:hypothetical protein